MSYVIKNGITGAVYSRFETRQAAEKWAIKESATVRFTLSIVQDDGHGEKVISFATSIISHTHGMRNRPRKQKDWFPQPISQRIIVTDIMVFSSHPSVRFFGKFPTTCWIRLLRLKSSIVRKRQRI